ncbi:MAG: PHB depolymerase family esterase [Pseudomonadota bacterium]
MGFFTKAVSAAFLTLAPSLAWACGPDSDCALGDRIYRIQMPAGVDKPGAIVFAHGYQGTATGTMRNSGLRAMADRLGVALVAVKSLGRDWAIPGVPMDMAADGTQELAYFDALIPALADRHGIDTDRLMLSGFSAGGMVTWQIACDRGDLFAGYAPIAGTFWRPAQPETCPGGAVHMFHTHGLSDRIVPLEGRPIAETHQGSVPKSLEMLRTMGGYAGAERFTEAGLDCERATNPDGKLLEYCTHGGGHAMQAAYVERAWRRLEAAGAL